MQEVIKNYAPIVLTEIAKHEEGLTAKELHQALGINENRIRQCLLALVATGEAREGLRLGLRGATPKVYTAAPSAGGGAVAQ